MSRHGWQPGETLGVKDSAHSQHFSSASHTHIRVSRKDDTLGLGARARRPLEDNEPTGLDAFQGLLGRLNGKSEGELQKERRKVEDRRLMSYVERRWKTMYFVSGGFLVGDKKDEEEEEKKSADKKEKVALTKAAEVDSEDESSRSKRRSKEKKEKKESSESSKKEKKHKKDRRKKGLDSSDSSTDDSESTTKEKSKSRKDKKKKRKADDEEATPSTKEAEAESKLSKSPEPSVAAPVPPRQLKGRHVLRGRYIQSKRMATLDDKSLNEIFMVKAKA
ncbi:telomerase inhibitor [Ascosphaera pollenicola]|nr:telomerase inhibitor [Ascosphaera pollenicola]